MSSYTNNPNYICKIIHLKSMIHLAIENILFKSLLYWFISNLLFTFSRLFLLTSELSLSYSLYFVNWIWKSLLSFAGVGKSRLVIKYIKNALHRSEEPTIAVSFFTCNIMLDDVKIKLQVSTTSSICTSATTNQSFYCQRHLV